MLYLVSFLVIVFMSKMASAVTIHVPSEQLTIQAGIDVAIDGDTVLVAPGLYTGEGNRDIDFGGVNLSLVSVAGPDSTIIDCQVDSMNPHRGFLFQTGEDSTAMICGFTIRGGYERLGAGIHITGSTPTVRFCTITECYAVTDDISLGGGGIWLDNAATIDDCEFSRNTTNQLGGAILAKSSSLATISNSRFTENSSAVAGGAIYCWGRQTVITGCTFWDNHSDFKAGAVYVAMHNDAVIDQCDFTNNTATDFGGAIWSRINAIKLTNSHFTGNTAWIGGALGLIQTRAFVNNCRFEGNSATKNAGAILMSSAGQNRIRRCIFAGNTAAVTGGAVVVSTVIYDSDSSVFSNCTFVGNHALEASCIDYFDDSHVPKITLNGCLFAFNTGNHIIHCRDINVPRVECSNSFGNSGGDWTDCITELSETNGNFSSDPLFCDQANGDFSISSWSPCVPSNNACNTLIGALGVGCALTDCEIGRHNLPDRFSLAQNYPNPFNAGTRIEFSLARRSHVKVLIHNILGQYIATLVNQTLPVGNYSVEWDGTDSAGSAVATGVYFYQLKAGVFVETKKILLLK